GVAGRVRLLYPEVADGGDAVATMVHSKVMIVDDRVLRIGSANLNNRSMGTDTECDLAIEAADETQRRSGARIRNRLVREHCGAGGEEVAAALARTGSLIAVAEPLSAGGHRLRPVDDGAHEAAELAPFIATVADPEQPIGAEEFVSSMLGEPPPKRSMRAM